MSKIFVHPIEDPEAALQCEYIGITMITSKIHIEPTGSKIGAIVHNVDPNDKISSEERKLLRTTFILSTENFAE